ncbi:hypothetical protein STEG23_033457, partial [Scotinomys teguina]
KEVNDSSLLQMHQSQTAKTLRPGQLPERSRNQWVPLHSGNCSNNQSEIQPEKILQALNRWDKEEEERRRRKEKEGEEAVARQRGEKKDVEMTGKAKKGLMRRWSTSVVRIASVTMNASNLELTRVPAAVMSTCLAFIQSMFYQRHFVQLDSGHQKRKSGHNF